MLIIKKKIFQKMTNNYKKCTPELRQLRTQKMKLSTNHQPFFSGPKRVFTRRFKEYVFDTT